MTLKLYPSKLLEEIRKKKKYIPRKLRKNERLRLNRKYWIPDYGIIKVKEIIDTPNGEHYVISYNNGNMNGVVSYPTTNECYEMLKNFNELESINFINKKKSVYGAEIKYWFIINDIDFNDIDYSGFLDKIQYLKDSTKYIVHRNKKKKEYDFIIDTSNNPDVN